MLKLSLVRETFGVATEGIVFVKLKTEEMSHRRRSVDEKWRMKIARLIWRRYCLKRHYLFMYRDNVVVLARWCEKTFLQTSLHLWMKKKNNQESIRILYDSSNTEPAERESFGLLCPIASCGAVRVNLVDKLLVYLFLFVAEILILSQKIWRENKNCTKKSEWGTVWRTGAND